MSIQLPVAFAPYVLMVFLTVAAPGPGQLMTAHNALTQGVGAAMAGVAGLCLGTVLMSGFSLLGVGGLLLALPQALWALKLAGACYLVWLAWKAWRSASVPRSMAVGERNGRPWGLLLRRGFLLQTVNPKPVLFFMAVLPPVAMQGAGEGLALRHASLAVGVYVLALVVVHGALAVAVSRGGQAMVSQRNSRWLRRGSALCFVAFAGLMLLP